jgi:hypothetical protein
LEVNHSLRGKGTRYVWWLLCGLVLASAVRAESVASMQKRAEASMLVTGFVDIAPDGALSSMTMDHPELLPDNVKALVSRASAHWRFEPDVDENATTRHVPMSLRVVARTESDGVYRSRIRGATFGGQAGENQIRVKSLQPPKYPMFAARYRISGDVYLLLRINPQGAVTDVTADQVNLDTVTDQQLMRQIRKLFADASVDAARHWKYEVLQPGKAGDGAWLVRTPIHFAMLDPTAGPLQLYGQWLVYVPGPLEPVVWLEKYGLKQPTDNTDSMPTGRLQLLQQQVALVTPLDSE